MAVLDVYALRWPGEFVGALLERTCSLIYAIRLPCSLCWGYYLWCELGLAESPLPLAFACSLAVGGNFGVNWLDDRHCSFHIYCSATAVEFDVSCTLSDFLSPRILGFQIRLWCGPVKWTGLMEFDAGLLVKVAWPRWIWRECLSGLWLVPGS